MSLGMKFWIRLGKSEREKRTDSIILRGFGTDSVEVVKGRFTDICSTLTVESVDLIDVKSIGSSNLFRARTADPDKRRNLLMKSHELNTVFIHRDLTYQQR